MSLTIKKVKCRNQDVKKIYTKSFSKEERMPFTLMVLLTKITRTDFLGFYDDNRLCGFIYMATIHNVTFIMFLAVEPELRSKGYGSQIVREVQHLYPANKIIVSIERCDTEAANQKDRLRRKQFYLQNGFADTGYLMELSHIEQEVLITNGAFSKEEMTDFFQKYSNGTIKPKIWQR